MVYPNDNIVNAILLLLGIALKEMLKTSYCFLRVVSCFSMGENGIVNVWKAGVSRPFFQNGKLG